MKQYFQIFARLNSDCINTVGSFSCTCKTGFENFVPHDGCLDIDECATGNFHTFFV